MKASFPSLFEELGLTALRSLSAGANPFTVAGSADHVSPRDVSTSVWLCREWATDRLLVVKLWPQAISDCAQREAKALTALGSLGLTVPLSLVFQYQTRTVIVRPFVAGSTLLELAPFLDELGRRATFEKITNVVQKIHHAGWAHRDLSPSNIVINHDRVDLLDWDLAESLANQNTDSFQPRGTPGFSITNRDSDLSAQDVNSLEEIARFLNIETSAATMAADSTQPKRNSWWGTLFSARP